MDPIQQLKRAKGWLKYRRRPSADPLHRHLRLLLADAQVDLVLDVGAHTGGYVRMLRRWVRYRGPIVSFEPTPESFARLTARFGGDTSWSGRQAALGSAAGTAQLNAYGGQLNSLLDPSAYGINHDQRLATRPQKIDVPMHRLDEFEFGESRSIFLKIDTQGSDMSVLRGSSGLADKIRVLQMEVPASSLYEGTPGFGTAIQEILDMGFELTGVFPVLRDAAHRVIDADCTFKSARPERAVVVGSHQQR